MHTQRYAYGIPYALLYIDVPYEILHLFYNSEQQSYQHLDNFQYHYPALIFLTQFLFAT